MYKNRDNKMRFLVNFILSLILVNSLFALDIEQIGSVQVNAVMPGQIVKDENTTISIKGDGFSFFDQVWLTPKVDLNSYILNEYTTNSGTTRDIKHNPTHTQTAVLTSTEIILYNNSDDELLETGRVDRNITESYSTHPSLQYSKDGLKIFIQNYNSFNIYDVATGTPNLLGSYHTNALHSFTINSDTTKGYLLDQNDGLIIIDITDPTDIKKITQYDFLSMGDESSKNSLNTLKIELSKDNYTAYISRYRSSYNDDNSTFYILDLSDEEDIKVINSYKLSDVKTLDLDTLNNRLFVLDYESGLKIFDVSDSSDIKLLKSFDLYGYYDSLVTPDFSKIYISNSDKIEVYDIDMDNNFTHKGNFKTYSFQHISAFSKDLQNAYFSYNNNSFIVAKVIDTPNKTQYPTLLTQGTTNNLVFNQDNTLAFITDEIGLKIIDINDSNNPKIIGVYDTNGSATSVTLSQDEKTIYICDGYINTSEKIDYATYSYDIGAGVKVVDISDPTNPTLKTVIPVTDGKINQIVLSDDETVGYVATGELNTYNNDYYTKGKFLVYDLSDILNPILLSTTEFKDVTKIQKHKTKPILFVADNYTLRIIDISTPSEATEINNINIIGNKIYDIVLNQSSDKIYIAKGTAGFSIYDISTPSGPTLITKLGTYTSTSIGDIRSIGVSKNDTKLYLAEFTSGIKIYDITNDTTPIYLSTLYSDNLESLKIDYDNGLIYSVNGKDGLNISSTNDYLVTYIDSQTVTFNDTFNNGIYDMTLFQNSNNYTYIDSAIKVGENIDFSDIIYNYIDSVLPNTVISGNDSYFYLLGNFNKNSTVNIKYDTQNKNQIVNTIFERTKFLKKIDENILLALHQSRLSLYDYSLNTTLTEVGSIDGYFDTADMDDDFIVTYTTSLNHRFEFFDKNGSSFSKISEHILDQSVSYDTLLLKKENTILYASTKGVGLDIFDITDKDSVKNIYSLDIDLFSFTMNKNKTRLYLATRSGMSIYDITTDSKPILISELFIQTYADINSITLNDDETVAYLTSSTTYIVDVGDESDLKIVSNSSTPSATKMTLSSNGGKGYIVGNKNLITLDIRKDETPSIVGSIALNENSNSVVVNSENTYGYVATNNYLYIVDLANPNIPTLVSNISTTSRNMDVIVDENKHIAYTIESYIMGPGYIPTFSGLKIFDISSAEKPIQIGEYATKNAKSFAIDFNKSIAYIADNDSGALDIKVVDISDVNSMNLITSIETNGSINKIKLNNDKTKLFVAQGSSYYGPTDMGGLYVYDIEDLNNTQFIGNFKTTNMIDFQYDVNNSRVVTIDSSDGLNIIDISNFTSLGNFSIKYGFSLLLNQDNTKAFVGASGLNIFDISDPSNITKISNISDSPYIYSMFLSKNEKVLYASKSGSGINIIDISDITNPFISTTIQMSETKSIKISNDNSTGYIADGIGGFKIINIPAPTLNITPSSIEQELIGASLVNSDLIPGIYNVTVNYGDDNFYEKVGALTVITPEEEAKLKPVDLVLRTIDGEDGNIKIDLKKTNAIRILGLMKYDDGKILNALTDLSSEDYSISISNKKVAEYYNDKLVFKRDGIVTVTLSAKGFNDSLTFFVGDVTNIERKQALIVVGHLDDSGEPLSLYGKDPLRYAINKIANRIYKHLYRYGINGEDILYFNPNGEQYIVDEDNDMEKDNAVDHISFAWEDVVQGLNDLPYSSEPLLIYLINHGDKDGLYIGEKIHVTPQQINTALDQFQAATDRDVIVIVDACYSGAIGDVLKQTPKRLVVTSSDASNPTYMDRFGNWSFSSEFFKQLNRGNNFQISFTKAKENFAKRLAKKNLSVYPQYANETTTLSKKLSKTLASPLLNDDFRFSDFEIGNGEPEFTYLKELDLNTSATQTLGFSADVNYKKLIKSYAIIMPPTPVVEVGDARMVESQKVDMTYNETEDLFETDYTFDEVGDYIVNYAIEDDDGNIYLSDAMTVTQSNVIQDNNDSKIVELTKGWNLVSLDLNVSDLSSNTQIIWQYNSGIWSAYSPNEQIQSVVESSSNIMDIIDTIDSSQGTWIFSLKDENLSIVNSTSILETICNDTWSLSGTNKDINTTDISCNSGDIKSIWKYKNETWMLNTDIENNLDLESFDTIYANEGFWIYIE